MSTSLSEPLSDQQALEAIVNHHAALRAGLDQRLRELRAAVAAQLPVAEPANKLNDYLDVEILPHAAAEESTLYAAAGEPAALFVAAMMRDHEVLRDRAHALVHAADALEVLSIAEGIAAVFALHVEKENDILLPTLVESNGPRLAALLQQMQQQLDDMARWRADGADGEPVDGLLDVRELPHGAGRHEAIFGRLAALATGEALVIVNDHDPKPLHYQLDAAWPGSFGWAYEQAGPTVWRVAITRLR